MSMVDGLKEEKFYSGYVLSYFVGNKVRDCLAPVICLSYSLILSSSGHELMSLSHHIRRYEGAARLSCLIQSQLLSKCPDPDLQT